MTTSATAAPPTAQANPPATPKPQAFRRHSAYITRSRYRRSPAANTRLSCPPATAMTTQNRPKSSTPSPTTHRQAAAIWPLCTPYRISTIFMRCTTRTVSSGALPSCPQRSIRPLRCSMWKAMTRSPRKPRGWSRFPATCFTPRPANRKPTPINPPVRASLSLAVPMRTRAQAAPLPIPRRRSPRRPAKNTATLLIWS